MNLSGTVTAAWNKIPADLKGMATLTRQSGSPSTTTVEVTMLGAARRRGDPDGFREAATIETHGRRFILSPVGADFPPEPNMTIAYGGTTYQVLGVAPVDPAGTGSPVLYRVTATT